MSEKKITKKEAIQITEEVIEEDYRRMRELSKIVPDILSLLHKKELTRVIEYEDMWIIEYQPVRTKQVTIEGGYMTFRIDKISGAIIG